MPSRRLQRVRELLKREISTVIRREIPATEAGLVSVNDVEVAGDLRSAVVFVSILGSAEQQHRGMAMLRRHRHRLQDLVAHAVVLKYVPVLKFVQDESVERGNRVLAIIEELERAQPPTSEPES